ncbi:putative damage-inducible protein DinB [Chryseobacterium ginsenosidimutans]|uniref:DinB family protein n=1 Tax=Chryseobacterium ginsenosidimutans TaxID=687846 RepID=UPI00216916E6|nr:DinB family protein [Chryseobacterium ginsenosidimutans]MCS3871560.1 putative damage-inducible protein DinB [Chryseobacterium ginsenosidimutans]
MTQNIEQNLKELISTFSGISNELYTQQSHYLFGSTIGQHIRHILEVYEVVLNGYLKGKYSFEDRKRDKDLEENPENMMNKINWIISEINKEDKGLICVTHQDNGKEEYIKTTYFRELLYCFEHGIHHQALIKVALREFEWENIPQNFGVAPSTIKFRLVCAQ